MREIIDGLGYAPRTCTWELTLQCNLRCGHCGSSAGHARPREMPRQRALEVVAELAALRCRRISLSGGEPTLSPHWEAIAAEGARLGVRMNMITNGVGASRELVRRAKEAGLASLGVSLDGMAAVHDRYRGRTGLFSQVMQLLDHCHAVGLPVGVITTIQRDNQHDLDRMHELIAGRVYVWQLQIGSAMGNLADRHEQIRPEDLLHVVPSIASLIERGGVDIRVGDNIGYYGPYETVLRSHRSSPVPCWVGCYAGCRHLGIEADGAVKGCLSIQATREDEGNLQQEPLSDIWHREGGFAINRHFSVDDLSGFCRTCEHAAVCRGGCVSMRTCEGGGDNPFCYHRVATLAERREQQREGRRYVPLVLAPAALLASFGLGCASSPGPNTTPTATVDPVTATGQPTATPTQTEPEPPVVDEYGEVEPPVVSEYAVVEPPSADEYGLEPPIDDLYGMQ